MRDMEVFYRSKHFKRSFKNPVLTIGNFDGVHLGHQRIFDLVRRKSREIGGESIVYTFDPHPVKLLAPERKPLLITPLDEKLRLIAEQGIDVAVVAKFTREYAEQTADQFVKEVLYDEIKIRHIFVGHDFTFGKGRQGNIALLMELGKKYGFHAEMVEAVRMDGLVISSTKIRQLLLEGRVRDAAKMLGRSYLLKGEVIHGHGRGGKKLGFPTANIKPAGELIPKPGIYAVWTLYAGQRYAGVVNLGWNPTFQDQKFSVEVHILDFHEDIYGEPLALEFIERLRDERAFKGPEELIAQIQKDIFQARQILSSKGKK